MVRQQFGGAWTEEKLERLAKYLPAYTRIFHSNERASFFSTWYVDAFAGSGTREEVRKSADSEDAEEAVALLQGSVLKALDTQPPFDRYVFVEKNSDFAAQLEQVVSVHPLAGEHTRVEKAEANRFLQEWCRSVDWNRNRAVVFLDPYGADVDWTTIEAMAATEAVDLWILFPLGQAVNRMLTRRQLPPESWGNRLTRVFGTDEWKQRFYSPPAQGSLFSNGTEIEKQVTLDEIGDYFVERLGSIFPGVAKNALPLLNSRGVPIFLLCFAAANPKGARTAVKIADYILKGKTDG